MFVRKYTYTPIYTYLERNVQWKVECCEASRQKWRQAKRRRSNDKAAKQPTNQLTNQQTKQQASKQAYKACKIWDRGKEHSKSFVYRSCPASGVPSSDVPRYMRLLLPTTLFFFFMIFFVLFSLFTVVYTYFLFLQRFLMDCLCFYYALRSFVRSFVLVWGTKKYCFYCLQPVDLSFATSCLYFALLFKPDISCFVYTWLLCCVSVFGEDEYVCTYWCALGVRCQRDRKSAGLRYAHIVIESRTRIRSL